MNILEAEAAIRQAATDLSTLPKEIATAIHAQAAGIHPHDVRAIVAGGAVKAYASDVWAQRRAEGAADVEDIPGISEGVDQVIAGIAKIKASIPARPAAQ